MSQLPRYVPVRPDRVAWTRSFATETAAWRAVVGGTNSGAAERRSPYDL